MESSPYDLEKLKALVELSWFNNLPNLRQTKFINNRSSRAISIGMADLQMIHSLGKPIPTFLHSLKKQRPPKKKPNETHQLVSTPITKDDKAAIERERCRHLLFYCSHSSSACRNAAAQYLWQFRASLSLKNFSREFLTTALSSPQPTSDSSRCYALIFGITSDRAEEMHSFRDGFIGIKLVDWLIPQANTTTPLPPLLHKTLREIASEYPFPVQRKIANHPSLNWRVFSQLLSRGLPLHSLEAIAATDYQAFLTAASPSEKSDAQSFLTRIAKLSPDLKGRVLTLVGSHPLSDS